MWFKLITVSVSIINANFPFILAARSFAILCESISRKIDMWKLINSQRKANFSKRAISSSRRFTAFEIQVLWWFPHRDISGCWRKVFLSLSYGNLTFKRKESRYSSANEFKAAVRNTVSWIILQSNVDVNLIWFLYWLTMLIGILRIFKLHDIKYENFKDLHKEFN